MAENYNQLVLIITTGAISSCQLHNFETNLSIWLKSTVINKQKSSYVMNSFLNLGFAPQIMVSLLTSHPQLLHSYLKEE